MSGLIPLTVRDIKKWYRNPTFFFVGLIQPFFWIALFGSALSAGPFGSSSASVFLEGAHTYITFILGGVLTTTALFTGMFSGINIIWDRRLGTLSRLLSSPISRSSIVFSKILAAMVRILVQVVILFIAALVIPNGLELTNGITLLEIGVIIAAVLMIAFIFSAIFSIIAVRMRNMQTIFGITNLVNLPLMFASFALFPPSFMASWLKTVAYGNPVSWSAIAMRDVIINGTVISSSQMYTVGLYLLYLGILTVVTLLLVYFVTEKEIRE